MRRNPYILRITIFFCTLLSACQKYLDVTPRGYTVLTTVGDYDQWLTGAAEDIPPAQLDLLTDYVAGPNPVPGTADEELVYTWAPQFSLDLQTAPLFWGNHYARINKFNTVLLGIDAATDGTAQQKKSLRAEALLGRALEYLCLVNEYGKEYDSATAGTDPGVPFITSNDVSQHVPPRSTVEYIYHQIISDLNAALPDLPQDNSQYRLRGSIAAGYSVLARVYFFARNYMDAAKNAQLALQNSKANLLDFNALPPIFTNSVIPTAKRGDIIYGRVYSYSELASLSFVHSYDPHDLRTKMFSPNSLGDIFFIPLILMPYLSYSNFGTSVQEMKLIIAEGAARSGDLPTALQQINEIRVRRFEKGYYQPLQSTNQDTVLKWVLRERLFELPYQGLRWFDMRRLDAEGRMPTVNRYDAQHNIIATLPPHSRKYVLQIPVQVLQFNPGMEQNPQ